MLALASKSIPSIRLLTSFPLGGMSDSEIKLFTTETTAEAPLTSDFCTFCNSVSAVHALPGKLFHIGKFTLVSANVSQLFGVRLHFVTSHTVAIAIEWRYFPAVFSLKSFETREAKFAFISAPARPNKLNSFLGNQWWSHFQCFARVRWFFASSVVAVRHLNLPSPRCHLDLSAECRQLQQLLEHLAKIQNPKSKSLKHCVKIARDSFRISAILPGSWPLFAPFSGMLTPSLPHVLDERCFGALIRLFFTVFACLVPLLLARLRCPSGFVSPQNWTPQSKSASGPFC